MRSDTDGPLSGEIFDDYAVLSLEDLCRLCAVEEQHIIELVEEGVLSAIQVDTAAVALLRRPRAPRTASRCACSGISRSICPASRWRST